MNSRISKIATGMLLCVAVSFASISLANNGNSTSSGNTFSDIDRIFEMQMRQMRAMQRQMDSLFRNFENNFQSSQITRTPIMVHSSGILSSGFIDKKDHYELEIKVDDLKNSKINITSEDGMIKIEVNKNRKIEKTKGNYGKIISYTNSSSIQSFTLPMDADPATIKAEEKGNAILLRIMKKKQSVSVPVVKKKEKSKNK